MVHVKVYIGTHVHHLLKSTNDITCVDFLMGCSPEIKPASVEFGINLINKLFERVSFKSLVLSTVAKISSAKAIVFFINKKKHRTNGPPWE